MNFKNFIKDKMGILVFNYTFLFFTILVIALSPLKEVLIDTIFYITIVNFVLLSLYLILSYIKKKKFLTLIDEGVTSNNYNDLSIYKATNEENLYLDIIRKYKDQSEYIINENINKLKENQEIMSMWVHDVKMPISIIKLIIEQNDNPYVEKILDEIDNEVMRIENAVERVLYLSRLEDFHRDFLVQEVNLEKTIREVIRKYAKYFIANKIKLNLSNLEFTVLSDKKWLQFIFDQLIGNALKYTNSEDSISIVGEIIDGYLKIKIKDSGCGIKKEDINRIFDKGFTGNNGRNNSKSTGLGLYLVKDLCNKLDHKIELKSIYGEYTEFTIVIRKKI